MFLMLYNRYKCGVCKSTQMMEGKTVLITGGDSGIGYATARDMARRGAKVIIASNNRSQGAWAVDCLINQTKNRDVEYRYLELNSFASVRDFVDRFQNDFQKLDVLINNAAVVLYRPEPLASENDSGTENTEPLKVRNETGLQGRLKGSQKNDAASSSKMKYPTKRERDMDPIYRINYYSHVLLTLLLLQLLKQSAPSRIVIVTSFFASFGEVIFHDLGFKKTDRAFYLKYADTKLMLMMMTRELSKRLKKTRVTVNCVNPGISGTGIFNPLVLPARLLLRSLSSWFFKTPEEGAQSTIHCAVADEVGNVSGEYFSDCKRYGMIEKARNNALCEKLWEKSIDITSTGDVKI